MSSWIDSTYAALREHPVTSDNRWLIATAYALVAELTTANKRINDLENTLELIRTQASIEA